MKRFNRKLAIVTGLLLALVIGVGIGNGLNYNSEAKTPQKVVSEPTREQLLTLVNAERAKHNAPPLAESPILDVSAQWKADDEVKYGYFGHVRPGTTGNDGLDYLNSLHPPCSYVSENLHWANPNILNAQEAVNDWLGSAPHREAMLDPSYSLTGFGINGKQVVEHFCRP